MSIISEQHKINSLPHFVVTYSMMIICMLLSRIIIPSILLSDSHIYVSWNICHITVSRGTNYLDLYYLIVFGLISLLEIHMCVWIRSLLLHTHYYESKSPAMPATNLTKLPSHNISCAYIPNIHIIMVSKMQFKTSNQNVNDISRYQM